MILNYGLMFNRFGEETENMLSETATITIEMLDAKLLDLKTDFQKSAKQMFSNIETHVKKSEELTKAITVEKNYISVGNKRIVSVGRAINKNDVVIKSQLENSISTTINLTNTVIKNHIKEFDKLKSVVDQHIQKFENYHTHIKDTLQELLDTQTNHNSRIITLEAKP